MRARGLLDASPQLLRIFALVAVTGLVVLFFATQIENYLNGRLFNRISSSVAVMALIAVGQTLVILTRNIDLSVGSVVGFTAFAAGSLVAAVPDLHPLLLVGFAAALGGMILAAVAVDTLFLRRLARARAGRAHAAAAALAKPDAAQAARAAGRAAE